MQGRNDARAHGCCFWHRNHQLPNSQINLCLKITWFAVLLGIYTVSSFLLTSVKECIEYYLTQRLCEMQCNSLFDICNLIIGFAFFNRMNEEKKIYLSLLIKISLDMNHLKHWFERKIKTHAKYELFVDVLLALV